MLVQLNYLKPQTHGLFVIIIYLMGDIKNILNLAELCWGPPEPKLRFVIGEEGRKIKEKNQNR